MNLRAKLVTMSHTMIRCVNHLIYYYVRRRCGPPRVTVKCRYPLSIGVFRTKIRVSPQFSFQFEHLLRVLLRVIHQIFIITSTAVDIKVVLYSHTIMTVLIICNHGLTMGTISRNEIKNKYNIL